MKKQISLSLILLMVFTFCFGTVETATADTEIPALVSGNPDTAVSSDNSSDGMTVTTTDGTTVVSPSEGDVAVSPSEGETAETEPVEIEPDVIATYVGVTSVSFEWKPVEGAEGYAVYRYLKKADKEIYLGSVTECKFTATKLFSAMNQHFRIYPYTLKPGFQITPVIPPLYSSVTEPTEGVVGTDPSSGSSSDNTTETVVPEIPAKEDSTKIVSETYLSLDVKTKPLKATILGAETKFPFAKVTWKTVDKAEGYQIWYSDTKDFATHKYVWVKAGSKSSMKVEKLTDGTTYYFKVRAYTTDDSGKKLYGRFSKVKSATVKSSGWKTINKKDYYYYNGRKAVDLNVKIGNHPYYFDENGNKVASSRAMWEAIKDCKSDTNWAIAVDRSDNRTVVYKKTSKGWKMYRYMLCSCGKASSPTKRGTWKISGRIYGFGEPDEYSVYNATRIHDKVYFHSILYKFTDHSTVIDGRLGMNISHGCIRMSEADSLWIYNNMPNGTTVTIVA